MTRSPTGIPTSVESIATHVESQDTFVHELAERVRTLAKERGLNATALGDRLKIASSSAANYWKGKRVWPTELLLPLANILRTTVDDLVAGPSSTRPDSTNVSEEELDLVPVQEIDLAYGLGGTFSDFPVEVEVHRFPRPWLQKITSAPPALLTIARGRGDSMQPTLQDGDMVMIDRSQRIVREQDAIWALTVGDIAMIKRLRIRGERVLLLSDNDRVPPDEAHAEEINIVGRIIFIGRRL